MNSFVSDTMAIVLRLEKRKLPQKVKNIFEKAEDNSAEIFIPSLVVAELAYLSEKNRIECSIEKLEIYLKNHKNIQTCPIQFSSVKKAFMINDIPELHDRLIAGVASELSLELITNDPKIRASKFVRTIWD